MAESDSLEGPVADEAPRLSIVSWNLFQGTGAPRNVVDHIRRHYRILVSDRARRPLTDIVDVIAGADIACLQEVDEGSWRNGYRNQLAELGELAQLPYRYFAAQRRGYLNDGVALASKRPLYGPCATVLVHEFERRCLVDARVRIGSRFLRIYVAHLAAFPFNAALRRRQVEQIVRVIRKSSGPFVVCADYNCDVGSGELAPLVRGCGMRPVVQSATFPVYRPTHRFDNIFVSQGVRVVEACVLKTPGSDHLPVWAVVELPTAMSREAGGSATGRDRRGARMT